MSGAKVAVQLDHASFRYVDESEDEAGAQEAAPVGSRVDDLSFTVAPGACTVLCGRSGDGKSTVLRLVNGLAGTFFPGVAHGVVAVCGTEVHAMAPRQRTERMGVVMQDPRSQFFMGTVGDEVAFSSENLGVDPAETRERVQRAATLCGVGHLLAERLDELSSGQKQRVALAAAIACDPQVLVLDEPTSNLDEEGSEALVDILVELKRRGVAIVVSEHRLHRFLKVADAYVCLRAGRIVRRWDADAFARLTVREAAAFGLRHPAMEAGSASASAAPGTGGGWRVEGLTYVYPSTRRGVRALDAHIPAGAVTVVAGPNGAGKTTLARVLCGAVRTQAGAVTLDGAPVSRRVRRRLSYFVMQDADYQLYAGSVADEVVLGRRVDDALKARAWEALEAFDLVDLADRHPASLSGGQKQRVTLAAAYCSDAQLVVLDEPTSGLDGRGVSEVAQWCRALAAAGKAVVVITHDELLARLAGDCTVRLEAGIEGTTHDRDREASS